MNDKITLRDALENPIWLMVKEYIKKTEKEERA